MDCEKKHETENCRIATGLQARKAIIKRLCFICLKQSHVAKECKSKISCFICKNRHHAAYFSNYKKEENSSLTYVASEFLVRAVPRPPHTHPPFPHPAFCKTTSTILSQ